MNAAPALALETTIVVIGAGRLGRVLARALAAAGFDVRGPIGRDAEVPDADIVLLCVPDAEIPRAAISARGRARLIGHVSGATPLEGVDFSIHPLQTFTGSEAPDVFHGIGAAVAGRTGDARDVAEQLAHALGARPFAVDDTHRATYHAAASVASNFVLTVLDAAAQLASASGIPQENVRELLAPLTRRTLDNWESEGAARALTGPIARGDEGTVARQYAALDRDAPHLRDLFDALASATRILAAHIDQERPA